MENVNTPRVFIVVYAPFNNMTKISVDTVFDKWDDAVKHSEGKTKEYNGNYHFWVIARRMNVTEM